MAYAAVTVTVAATLIVAANPNRQSVYIQNRGTVPVFIGTDTSITTVNTIAIDPSAILDEDSGGTKQYTGPIYGIVSAGTADVRYWERTIQS